MTGCGGAGTGRWNRLVTHQQQDTPRTESYRGNSEPGSHSVSTAGSDLLSAPVTSRRTTLRLAERSGGAEFQGAPPALRGAGRLDTVASCDRCRQSRSGPTQLTTEEEEKEQKKEKRRLVSGGSPRRKLVRGRSRPVRG